MKQKLNQLDAEGRRHGLWKSYHPNGTTQWGANYHHGKLHGLWEFYYNDGTLQEIGHYHHGRLKGVDKWWNLHGDIRTKQYHLVLR
jgi:uncharacterized protein